MENYIASNFKSVLIKRHPRDKAVYDFGKNVSVSEIEQKIPAEVMLPYLSGYTIIFMAYSSITLYLDSLKCNSKFIYFNDLNSLSKKENNCSGFYPSKEEFINFIKINLENAEIIDLDIKGSNI